MHDTLTKPERNQGLPKANGGRMPGWMGLAVSLKLETCGPSRTTRRRRLVRAVSLQRVGVVFAFHSHHGVRGAVVKVMCSPFMFGSERAPDECECKEGPEQHGQVRRSGAIRNQEGPVCRSRKRLRSARKQEIMLARTVCMRHRRETMHPWSRGCLVFSRCLGVTASEDEAERGLPHEMRVMPSSWCTA